MIIQVFHFYPLNSSKAWISLFPLQSFQPVNLLVERFGAHCNQNFHCSTQFHANFVYTKKVVLWVCTFWRTKRVSLNIPINETSRCLYMFLAASSEFSTMQDILLRKSTELKMERREFYVKAKE